jgi:hypothetical protein
VFCHHHLFGELKLSYMTLFVKPGDLVFSECRCAQYNQSFTLHTRITQIKPMHEQLVQPSSEEGKKKSRPYA